jgi:uncharacterized protein with FMN-binding domain
VANSLVALSSAAVLTVYAAGYLRTKSAAGRFAVEAAERRPAALPGLTAAPPAAPAPAPQPVVGKPASRKVSKRPATVSPVIPTAAPAPATTTLPATTTPVAPVGGAAAETPTSPTTTPQGQYKDGTYSGWGTSRHGDIQASVVIENGRIASASIAQCLTRYSCSWIAHLPPQVVSRQSPEVDYVSGATQSVNAFYYAVVEALSKAK